MNSSTGRTCRFAGLIPGWLTIALALPLIATRDIPDERTPAASPVDYVISPRTQRGSLRAVRIAVRFRANADGRTVFGWTSQWAGEKQLWRWVRNLRFSGAERAIPLGKGRYLIRSRPRAILHARYDIVSAYSGMPGVTAARQARPIILPDRFYVVGETLFGRPEGRPHSSVTLLWNAESTGFKLATDLPTRRAAMDVSEARTLDDLTDSILVGGRGLSLVNASVRAPAQVAMIGRFAFSPAALAKLSSRIVRAERDFWHQRDDGAYLVSAVGLPAVTDVTGFTGIGRRNGFALWIDSRMPLADIRTLLAHEYFHHWNGRSLGSLNEQNQAAEFWFTEGFTDYYARALLVRNGVLSPEEFAEAWNTVFTAYAYSKAKYVGNSRAAPLFWSNEEFQQLPYQRGAILAALWNRKLRKASAGKLGIDDVLRSQRRIAKRSALTPGALFSEVAKDLGFDPRGDINRYIDSAAPIPLPVDTFGACSRLSYRQQAPEGRPDQDADKTASFHLTIIKRSSECSRTLSGL